ncbi:MAG: PaaI family thioesterase [Actinobacteria bacterium]|nr:PaaI family thioesterase [Actinomycetota bacterium]
MFSDAGGFTLDDIPTDEVDRQEGVRRPLADAVRDLVDATIRTTVPDDEVRAVQAEIEAAVARLRVSQVPGPRGIRYNGEGRSWSWGNAVVGAHNAIAPPLVIHHDPSGVATSDVVLGAAYEGPPGLVHGGVTALLLDHLMGETASGFAKVTMTGTLTMRYRRGTPLGALHLEGRIDREEGRKVYVVASIGDADGPTVEADGVFIVPRWAADLEETR